MTHPAPLLRGRRKQAAVGSAVLLVLLVLLGGVVFVGAGDDAERLAAGGAVTASSTASGTAPGALLKRDEGGDLEGWRSANETVGAWIEVRWPQPHRLHAMSFRRATGIREGVVQFDDGSALQIGFRESDGKSVFLDRTVRAVRFTVTDAPADATDVALASVGLNDVDGTAATGRTDAVADAVVSTSRGEPGTDGGWRVDEPEGASVTYAWSEWHELAAIEVVGAADSDAAVTRIHAKFPDGGEVLIGAVESDPALSTKVAFLPRATQSVTLTLEGVEGRGRLHLAGIRLWERGSRAEPLPPTSKGITVEAPDASSCSPSAAPSDPDVPVVLCPMLGARVDDAVDLQVALPSGARGLRAEVWPAAGVAPGPHVETEGSGTVGLRVPLAGVPEGPLTIALTAIGGGDAMPVQLQLLHGQGAESEQETTSEADGRTLVYEDEFTAPVSIGRGEPGARYAAGKPEPWGYSDFGDAIFADPAGGLENVGVLDERWLRLAVAPNPPGYEDPGGYGRTRTGGMLASARSGGGGFSAQYGYFETRMLTPAAPGTWPAFWLLSSLNVVSQRMPTSEIDAFEHYGHDPTTTCHTTHAYSASPDPGVARCEASFRSASEAARWHVYGVSVEPDSIRFFIDGEEVVRSDQVPAGDEPLFFLVDLALGGGWPVDLTGTRDRAEVLVDYVRVYV